MKESDQGMVVVGLVREVGPKVIVGIRTGVVSFEYFGDALKVVSSTGMN